MLEKLKKRVFSCNQMLSKEGLVVLTWGNASAFDPSSELLVIKPSGVSYEMMSAEDMVVVDLNGKVVEGRYRPSSDTPTHIVLYKEWGDKVQGVVHTHSVHATSWAQSGKDLPIQGTTHADYFYGDIPCLGVLTAQEVEEGYEHFTGVKIVRDFKERQIDPVSLGACLLTGHGPFTWGASVEKAVENSIVLETIAQMGLFTRMISPDVRLPNYILDKHYLRKHGKNAYYGQK